MINQLAREVKKRMRVQKFPHPVIYAPEILGRAGFTLGVVFERDREAGDHVGAPVGWQRAGSAGKTADAPFARRVAGLVTVYVQSAKAGATAEEHEAECDLVCDGTLCAMNRVVKAAGLLLEIVDSRIVLASEFNQPDDKILPGCAARIRFRVAVPVRDVTYQGAGDLTGTVEHVHAPLVTDSTGEFPDFDPVAL